MISEPYLNQGMLIYANPDGTFRLCEGGDEQPIGYLVGDCEGDLITISIMVALRGLIKIKRSDIRNTKYPVFKKCTRFQILKMETV